ncbi:MAG: TnpV protein [Clostridia bacterium]|nr:TnpV protein [Clostridia bacterium]
MSITLKKVEIINGIPHLLNEADMKYYPTVTKDRQTGLTHTLDPQTYTYLPDLTVTTDERDIGIWGRKRMKFLKEKKTTLYLQLFDSHRLTDHLIEINETANSQMDSLTEEMMKKEGVTEKLKAENQMEWIRRMNSIANRAEEIVMKNLIQA